MAAAPLHPPSPDAADSPPSTTGDAAADAPPPVSVVNLRFGHPGTAAPLLDGFCLDLPAGARCLLVGANGAGKTTLLQVLAGHHMVPPDAVRVLGRPAFHDVALTSSGDLSYLGAAWRRDSSFAGSGVPLTADLGAGALLDAIPGADPARKAALIAMLGIDREWRLHRLSDGQRRRVQIAAGLLKPFRVLLLDEVTVDMDVLARADLLAWLAAESEERGCVIVYCTHIFDGLAGWATHLAHVARGELAAFGDAASVPALAGGGKLLPVVDGWLRAERGAARARAAEAPPPAAVVEAGPAVRKEPLFSSKHMAFYR